MKKQYLITALFCFLGLNIFSQGSFFKHEKSLDYSLIKIAREVNGYYLIGGGIGDNASSPLSGAFLLKLDKYGNIIDQYRYFDTSMNHTVFNIDVYNDSIIRLFIQDFGYTKTELLIQSLDLNFNLINEVDFHFPDSTAIGTHDMEIDEDKNYVIIGALSTHPLYTSPIYKEKFILKLSENLDSLSFYSLRDYSFTSIIDNPYNNLYYLSGYSYNLYTFNRNLDSIKTIRVDTFVPVFNSINLIDTNKIVIIGYNEDFSNNYHKPILIKTIDTLGNEYNRIEIDAPDTISTPGSGKMISRSYDSLSLYFSWKKNNIFMSNCNNGEPSYIGVGKFDINLNPIWVKYFGNDTVNYNVKHQTATSDGGVLVVGYYQHCEKMDPISHYFVLKVDANGNCTFMKDLPVMEKHFTVYPSPATNFISFKTENPATNFNQIIIYDINSKEVKNISKPLINKVNIENLKSGTYFIKVIDSEGNVYSSKFIKK